MAAPPPTRATAAAVTPAILLFVLFISLLLPGVGLTLPS
jgi:hypothetical protein